MKPHLPMDDYLPQIAQHLKQQANLVVTAEPGAGKTTRLPPALLKSIKGKILVLEPRRVAAIAAAQRIAFENSWQLGEEVGYQVRFDNKTSSRTRLIFMTEALLARQLLRDPEFKGIGAVVLDEFHERSLHVDLALGWLKELQDLGHPIQIIVMSATLQAEKISSYLSDAAIVQVPGKLFPLEIVYQKNPLRLITDFDFYKNMETMIRSAASDTEKDILVFLPGIGEISRLQENLQAWAEDLDILVLPLHGSLGLEEQKAALQSSSRQRVILATNLAESSVTVDGVGLVIDSGLAKVMRQDHRTGFSRLELSRISMSSAIQRAGRSARQFPGICYRMWTKNDEISFLKNEVPEIQRSDLSETLLLLAASGISDFKTFSWFEAPSIIAIDRAVTQLRLLHAIDSENKITSVGREMIRYPLSPRLAHMMLQAEAKGIPQVGADLVAILQERDFLRAGVASNYQADNIECDLTLRYQILNDFKRDRKSSDIVYMRAQNVVNASQQFQRLSQKSSCDIADADTVKDLLLTSFLDRLCRRRQKSDRARMQGGRGVKLETESLVKKSEFFLALQGLESEGSSETRIPLACGFDKEFLLKNAADEIALRSEIIFDEEKQKFFARRFRAIGDLAIEDGSLENAKPEDIQDQIPSLLLQKWDWLLLQNENLASWWKRWLYFQNESLTPKKIQEALAGAALGESNLHEIAKKDLVYFLESQLDPALTREFQKEVPDKIQMPTGSWIPVKYPEAQSPFLEVRIQEVFGMKETPKIMHGRVAILFHLLAPNYRPAQVTADLRSFWQNAYAEVRKELKIRYPKHSWPEDPLTADPVAKGRSVKR